MLEISSWIAEEKNKISQDSAWYYLVQIDFPGDPVTTARLTSNNQNVTYGGYTWQAIPIIIGDISENLDEVPQCSIKIGNALNLIESYMLAFAYYTKTEGSYSVPVTVMVMNDSEPTATPVSTHVFELQSSSSDSRWITLNVGASNPFKQRFPSVRLLKNQCQHKYFKGIDCGYSGLETVCDRTIVTCRTLSNSARFGGFPGVGENIFRG